MKILVETPKPRYLYVLQCVDDFYYVGQTTSIHLRFRQHLKGKGCWFTRDHFPLSIVFTEYIGIKTQSQAMLFENNLTYQYIIKYGVDKVRGGAFIQRNPRFFRRLLKQYEKEAP